MLLLVAALGVCVLHPMSYVVVGGMGVAMHGVAVYAHVYMGYEYMLWVP